AVVIVPLIHATGLNIKLVEAAAQGRAILTTPAPLTGAPFLRDAVAVEAQATDFATVLVDLLHSFARRQQLATRALEAVRQHLSPDACYRPLAEALLAPL